MSILFTLVAVVGLIGLIAMIYLCLEVVAFGNSERNRILYSGSLAIAFYIFPGYLGVKHVITSEWMLFIFNCPVVALFFRIVIKQYYRR